MVSIVSMMSVVSMVSIVSMVSVVSMVSIVYGEHCVHGEHCVLFVTEELLQHPFLKRFKRTPSKRESICKFACFP